jgi:hypothetical protein
MFRGAPRRKGERLEPEEFCGVKARLVVEFLLTAASVGAGFALARAYAAARASLLPALACGALFGIVVAGGLALRHRSRPQLTPLATAVPVQSSANAVRVDCAAAHEGKPSSARGSLDHVDTDEVGVGDLRNGAHVAASDAVVMTGWAIAQDPAAAAEGTCAVVDGRIVSRARSRYGIERDDVGAAIGAPALAFSGYSMSIPPGALRPGAHVLRVAVLTRSGGYALLPERLSIVVDVAR